MSCDAYEALLQRAEALAGVTERDEEFARQDVAVADGAFAQLILMLADASVSSVNPPPELLHVAYEFQQAQSDAADAIANAAEAAQAFRKESDEFLQAASRANDLAEDFLDDVEDALCQCRESKGKKGGAPPASKLENRMNRLHQAIGASQTQLAESFQASFALETQMDEVRDAVERLKDAAREYKEALEEWVRERSGIITADADMGADEMFDV